MQNKAKKTENARQSTKSLPLVKKFKRMSSDNKIKIIGGVVQMVFKHEIESKEALALFQLLFNPTIK